MPATLRALARASLPLLLLVAGSAVAELPALSPVLARYQVNVNGISVGTGAEIRITQLEGRQHEVTFNVRNRFFTHRESSRFDWDACRVRSQDYQVDFRGFGLDRHFHLQFDLARDVAVEDDGRRRGEIRLAGHVLDSLNMAQYARCLLREGRQDLHLGIVDRHATRDLHYAVTGREKVATGAGAYDTLVLESRHHASRFRRTRLWVAPALDWFMVRFEHVENPAVRGGMLLTALEPGPAPRR